MKKILRKFRWKSVCCPFKWIQNLIDWKSLHFFLALSQTSHTSRWSLLSIDETNDGQSIAKSRLKSTCLAVAEHFGRLLQLLGRIETVFDGTFDGCSLRSTSFCTWNGIRLLVKFTEDGSMWWSQECAECWRSHSCVSWQVRSTILLHILSIEMLLRI